jgi:hypothetical protein
MSTNPAAHFGRQIRKERQARGWTLQELSKETGIDATQLSRIERGERPPAERVAREADRVFPERKGYFLEYYEESRTWAPPGFRDWSEHEEKTGVLRDWSPTVITGLLQTADYARKVLETSGAAPEVVSARLSTRMERQRRLFAREVRAWFIVDEASLARLAGTPKVMAGQMARLIEVAALPNVTVQLLPLVVHPAGASGFVITDTAGYAEHVTGGYVFTEPERIAWLDSLFDTLRSECRPASESVAIFREMQKTWESGVSPLTAMPTAGTASKRPAVPTLSRSATPPTATAAP